MQIHAGKVQIPNGDVSSKGPTACDTRLSDFKKCQMNSAEHLKMSRTLRKVEASYSTPCGHLSQSGGNAISHGFSLHQAACGYARSGPSSSPSTGMRRKCAAFRAVNVNPSLPEHHPQSVKAQVTTTFFSRCSSHFIFGPCQAWRVIRKTHRYGVYTGVAPT